jgi:hypothetical protein
MRENSIYVMNRRLLRAVRGEAFGDSTGGVQTLIRAKDNATELLGARLQRFVCQYSDSTS